MTGPQSSLETPKDISLRSNWLTVDGHSLRAEVLENSRSEKLSVSSLRLYTILDLGREAILEGIEVFYRNQVMRHPDLTIVRPSIWTAQLGTARQTDGPNSRVLTGLGYANGGTISSIDEIKPSFHQYWNTVIDAGFIPEVRRTSGAQDGGAWLLLRAGDTVASH